jgi:uncharacterized RDD family membrane protein YckC
MYQENEPEVLTDIGQEIYMDPVSKGVRFVNYLIDQLMVCTVFMFIIIVLFVIDHKPGADIQNYWLLQQTLPAKLWQLVINIVAFISYYTFFETTTKGRTIGKMVTRSIAVTESGNQLTFKTALLRSLCRLIPFEPVAALFVDRPWHDTITKTTVIKKTW